MEIQEKSGALSGMSGWLVKDANISIAVDKFTGTQTAVCYPNHIESYQEMENLMVWLSEDELELLKKIFRIEE